MKFICALWIGCVLLGCAAVAQNPAKTARVLKGDTKGAAANNPLCKLFTNAEASKYIGRPVRSQQNAALGTGCQWLTGDDDEGDMIVQIVPAGYHEQPTRAKGFQRIAGMSAKAFVVPEFDGWKAAELRGNESIVVMVAGPAAKADTAIALLKETLARHK